MNKNRISEENYYYYLKELHLPWARGVTSPLTNEEPRCRRGAEPVVPFRESATTLQQPDRLRWGETNFIIYNSSKCFYFRTTTWALGLQTEAESQTEAEMFDWGWNVWLFVGFYSQKRSEIDSDGLRLDVLMQLQREKFESKVQWSRKSDFNDFLWNIWKRRKGVTSVLRWWVFVELSNPSGWTNVKNC